MLISARSAARPPLLSHSMDTAGPMDYRLVRVPPNRNPPVPRPVFCWDERAVPRFFGVGRGSIPGYSESSYWIDETPVPSEPIGFIPQTDSAEGTYGYWEAASGIANDKGVMIGESTCSAIFGSKLRGSGGSALLGYMELTRIALERCASAREACQLMGDLAVEHGFAGNTADLMGAAESLSVVDADEAWVMHVLPDDTGASAVWAAQRLRYGHAAVVPNSFVIRGIPLEALDSAGDGDAEGEMPTGDSQVQSSARGEAEELRSTADEFLVSANAREVAVRAGRWQPGRPFDFSAIFSAGEPAQRYYCGRRQWRALSLFAPSRPLPADYDDLITDAPYPFSVPTDAPLTVEAMRVIMRDTFAGTRCDRPPIHT